MENSFPFDKQGNSNPNYVSLEDKAKNDLKEYQEWSRNQIAMLGELIEELETEIERLKQDLVDAKMPA